MKASSLAVFVLPDGHEGELFTVGCDDLKSPLPQAALEAARAAVNINAHGKATDSGSLGSRTKNYSRQLIPAIRGADSGHNLTRCHLLLPPRPRA